MTNDSLTEEYSLTTIYIDVIPVRHTWANSNPSSPRLLHMNGEKW